MKYSIFPFVSLLIILNCGAAYGQDYAVPVETNSLQLSSNLGELRSTRFHAGVDFRTGGMEGVKIYATQDGYISRLCVAPYGYGNGVYITHPDGKVSVYGHLSRFTPDVAKYVTDERYRRESGSVDIWPSHAQFPVKKGQLIGYSGNTGSSYGAHLHFEIRDEANRTLNIMARGYYKVADNIKPTIHSVSYFVVDTLNGVPFHNRVSKTPAVNYGNGRFGLAGPLKVPGNGYFTLEVHDRKNNTGFNMAIYRITEYVDGQRRFEYIMDGLDYTQTRYAQTVASYAENLNSKYDVYRLAVQGEWSRLPFYGKVVDRGVIFPAGDKNILIEVEDDNGNVATMEFELEYTPELATDTVSVPTGALPVNYRREFRRVSDGLTIVIPANALYESVYYHHRRLESAPAVDPAQKAIVLSDFYEVHTTETPIHSSIQLSIAADVPEELRGKVMLARVVPGSSPARFMSATKAIYKDGIVTAKVNSFGVWCVISETTPPTISPSFKSGADLSGAKSLAFSIKDNLSGIASFRVEIDGKWALMEHHTVQHTLTHNFDDARFGKGKTHTIKVTLRDNMGNTTSYSGTYYR